MIRYDEGSKLVLYKDTEGYWTIGIGHLIKRDSTISKAQASILLDKELGVPTQGRITPSEQSYLFAKDLAAVNQGIAGSSFYSVYKSLDSIRQAAIQSMCFQLGVLGVSAFRKMWAALHAQDWKEAHRQALDSKWNKQTPNRAKRVAAVLLTGTFYSYK